MVFIHTNTFKYHVLAPMGKFQLELIYLDLSTVLPSNICMFLSCRPFVVITTLLTGLVGVEVTQARRQKKLQHPEDLLMLLQQQRAYRTETYIY